VQHELVAVGVGEARKVADAGVEGAAEEGYARGLELRARRVTSSTRSGSGLPVWAMNSLPTLSGSQTTEQVLSAHCSFGEIYLRPGLDLRQRQLVTITALTTLGGAEAQLEVHINAGLNVGVTAREVVEAILHCIPYTGFPRVLNAILVAKRVFEERDVDPMNEET
jgi:alkylhydroperoxidase/carboxymuconolactone decarboxylase family protein YurZ